MRLLMSLILGINLCSFGQSGTLRVVNPLVRVNDDVEIEFSMGSPGHSTSTVSGTLKVKDMALDTGSVIIGPLSIGINGQNFKTNEISLNIHPEWVLSSSSPDGIVVTSITLDTLKYIVIEQRISNPTNSISSSNNELTINKVNEKVIFAELDQELLERKGVKILSRHSSSGRKIVNLNHPGGSVSYKNTIYRYDIGAGFKTFTLTTRYFKNLPKDIKPNEVLVQKKTTHNEKP